MVVVGVAVGRMAVGVASGVRVSVAIAVLVAEAAIVGTAVMVAVVVGPIAVGVLVAVGEQGPPYCSISVLKAPLEKYHPTDHTSVGDIGATDTRLLAWPPTLWLGTCTHDVPFQCSVRVPVTVP
jgi:hypothetical protein